MKIIIDTDVAMTAASFTTDKGEVRDYKTIPIIINGEEAVLSTKVLGEFIAKLALKGFY